MQNTSLVKSHEIGKTLFNDPTKLAGLNPIDFDKAIKPIREYLEQFNEDGKLAELMLKDNVTNYCTDGLYVRELKIPQGSFIISRVHKRSLINIISKGHVLVIDSNGRNEYKAPYTFISQAGTQRIVIAIEETVWNTAHISDKVDSDELVTDLTTDNYTEYRSYQYQITHQEAQ